MADDILPGWPTLRSRTSPLGYQHMYREDEPVEPEAPYQPPMSDIQAGRRPAIEEIMDAYIRQFRVPDVEPEPGPPERRLAAGGRATKAVAGKKGTVDEGLEYYSKIPGQLIQTEQGFFIYDSGHDLPIRPYTERYAYNPKTGQIYEEVLDEQDRARYIPLGQREGELPTIATPGFITGGLYAIGRAAERQRLGLIVPDSVMAREAMEVAGLITNVAAAPSVVRGAATSTLGTAGGGSKSPIRIKPLDEHPLSLGPERIRGNPIYGAGSFEYEIIQDGVPVGLVRGMVSPDKPNEAYIARIGIGTRSEVEHMYNIQAHSIGKKGLMQIREAFRRDFPEVTSFTGGRVTGAGSRTQTVTIGMGGGDLPVRRQPPRQLDPAGFYSQASEALQSLPARGTGQQMFQAFTSRGVSESEIRHLNIDRLMLGDNVAAARRAMLDSQATVGAMRGEARQLADRAGRKRWIKNRVEEGDSTRGAIMSARRRTAELAAKLPDAERRLASQEANFYGMRRRTDKEGNVTQEATAGIWDLAADRMITRSNVAAAINQSVPRVRETVYTPSTAIPPGTSAGTPLINKGYQQSTLDPLNPTLRWHTLRIDSPANPAVQRMWAAIPEQEQQILRSVWRIDNLRDITGLTAEQRDTIVAIRRRYASVLEGIAREEARHGYIDPHFSDLNIFGHYASSLQRTPSGLTTLNVSQFQSNWAPMARQARERADVAVGGQSISLVPRTIREHPIVENINSWLDPTLRRIIKDAVDQGADSITLPSAETVFRYNPPGDDRRGVTALYNSIAPRRLREMLREIDRGYKAKPEHIDRLHGDANLYPERSGGATGYGEIPAGHIARIREGAIAELDDVRQGFQGSWTNFPLTDKIRQHHQEGRGMRLLSGADDPRSAAIIAGITGAAGAESRQKSIANIVSPERRAARMADPQSLPRRIRRVQPTETEMRNYPRAERIELLEYDDPHPGPVIGFHATDQDFSVFDLSKSGDIGHHFGTREQASNRSKLRPHYSRVIPAYLNVQNPLRLPDLISWDPENVASQILQRVPGVHMHEASNLYDTVTMGGLTRQEQMAAIRSALTGMGYDAIRYYNVVEGSGWSYIVWTPGRVRSVTDPTHQLYSRGVPVPQDDNRRR